MEGEDAEESSTSVGTEGGDAEEKVVSFAEERKPGKLWRRFRVQGLGFRIQGLGCFVVCSMRVRCAREIDVLHEVAVLGRVGAQKKAKKMVLTGGSPGQRGWCQRRRLTQILKISALVHLL